MEDEAVLMIFIGAVVLLVDKVNCPVVSIAKRLVEPVMPITARFVAAYWYPKYALVVVVLPILI